MNTSAMLFPGQGVQYVGMGKWIYDKFPKVKDLYEEASDCLGYNIAELCFEGDEAVLSQTKNTQPAILTTEIAAAKVCIDELGYVPQYLAGHSLGEFAALTVAGGISFSDVIRIVALRGKLMQEAVANDIGVMSAIIGIEPYIVKEICEEICQKGYIVEISNYNSPTQTVISGYKKAVIEADKRFEGLNAKVIPLKVSAPFHCKLMKAAADQLEEELGQIVFHRLEYPVLSNVTGIPYIDKGKMKELLIAQMVRTVQWSKCMNFLQLKGIHTFIDIGPMDMLRNLVKDNCPNISSISVDYDDNAISVISDLC